MPCRITDSHKNVVKVMLLKVKRTSLSRTDMVIEKLIHSLANHPERLRAETDLANSVAEKALNYLSLLCISYSLI